MMLSIDYEREIASFSPACLDKCRYPLRSHRSCSALWVTSQLSCRVASSPVVDPGEGPRPPYFKTTLRTKVPKKIETSPPPPTPHSLPPLSEGLDPPLFTCIFFRAARFSFHF